MDARSQDSHSDGEVRDRSVAGFSETRWSQVVLAGNHERRGSREALARLCECYWDAIYGFLRRKGHRSHDAEDLTQQFFVRLLKSEILSNADRNKGRFRSFLLAALKHFLTDSYRRSSAQKRGGPDARSVLPFNTEQAERHYVAESNQELTPEEIYDRRWAASLLHQAFHKLRHEFETAGHEARFECLKGFLSGEAAAGEYEQAATQLDMTLKSTKMAVYRLRQRYRLLVREEVADTLADGSEIEDELQQLFG